MKSLPCEVTPWHTTTENKNRKVLDKHTYSRDVTDRVTKLGTVHSAVNFNSSSLLASLWNATCTWFRVMSRDYVGLCHEMGVAFSYFLCRGPQIFQKSVGNLKILGNRRVTWSSFHTEDPQIFGATIQNLIAWDLCTPDLLQTWSQLRHNTV